MSSNRKHLLDQTTALVSDSALERVVDSVLGATVWGEDRLEVRVSAGSFQSKELIFGKLRS